MKTENRYFDVQPKIVHADANAVITVKDRYNQSFLKDGEEYEVRCFHLEHFSKGEEDPDGNPRVLRAVNGALKIKQYFAGEQEHVLEIQKAGETEKPPVNLHVYSLKDDLFARNPYKGDIHMHSMCSDGVESPAFVAASCRKIGYDFMALTDHRVYAPSIAAQEAFSDVKHDLLICRGEEVHPPENPVHIINFGGSFSINEKMRNDSDGYYRDVNRIAGDLAISDEKTRYQCASSLWVFDKIRAGGGLSIFCHPYWLIRYGYYISEAVISFLLEKQPFDAYEVLGGYYRSDVESNTLAVARYQQERAAGKKIPIVGVSDSHGCENHDLFGWYYTIVFSPSLEQKEIIGGIRDLYSVAVEAIPGEAVRVYGPFRLVKYAYFLLRELLPEHDELCQEEGKEMMNYLEGYTSAADKLNALSGRTAAFIKMYKAG